MFDPYLSLREGHPMHIASDDQILQIHAPRSPRPPRDRRRNVRSLGESGINVLMMAASGAELDEPIFRSQSPTRMRACGQPSGIGAARTRRAALSQKTDVAAISLESNGWRIPRGAGRSFARCPPRGSTST